MILIGHSWGSILGVRIAQQRPDLVQAYVGVGQFVNTVRSKAASARTMEKIARADGDEAIADALGRIGDDPDQIVPNISALYRWECYYGGMVYRPKARDADILRSDYRLYVRAAPDYSSSEQKGWLDGVSFSTDHLDSEILSVDLAKDRKLSVPVLLLVGDHDLITNSDLASSWFKNLRAPRKRLVRFHNSAHMLVNEEPGKLLISLLDFVHPTTRDMRQAH